MNKKELMLAIESGLQRLWELSPHSVDHYNSIVYGKNDRLLPSRCTERILKQIEDDVMQFIQNS
jgi:hypothetical protein